MAPSSCLSTPRPGPSLQKVISVMILLVALYATASPTLAMANGSSSNAKTTLQARLVQALKEKGGFTAAATFLAAVDLNRLLPESSTLLAPMDQEVTESGLQVSTFNTALPILQYHVITKRLTFSDLQMFPEGQTLETLLPNNTVMITSNSTTNFTVDDVPISHGNLFLASSTAVHGIKGVLSFAMYGKKKDLHSFQPGVHAPPGTVGGPSAKQPIPPSDGNGNEPQSSTSPGSDGTPIQSSPSVPATVGLNSSTLPTTTPGTEVVSSNTSSSASNPPPSSVPSPLQTPKPDSEAPPSSSETQVGSGPFCTQLVCSVESSAPHLKPWAVKDIFSAVLFVEAVLLANAFTVSNQLKLMLYSTLVLMAATPTLGEMNDDVSEVLRGKGGFGYAATYLQALDMHRVLPTRSTVLVPTDSAIEATGLIYNTLGGALPTLKYHVVTKQLSFEDLQKLPVGTKLTTLMPSSLLVVTNNAASNFTVNDVLLSHPDIFCSGGTTVHGISGVMNLSRASNDPAVDTGLPQYLQTPPFSGPHLIFPLPESAGPFPTPLPVSQAASVLQILNIISRSTLMVVLLACTSSILPNPAQIIFACYLLLN